MQYVEWKVHKCSYFSVFGLFMIQFFWPWVSTSKSRCFLGTPGWVARTHFKGPSYLRPSWPECMACIRMASKNLVTQLMHEMFLLDVVKKRNIWLNIHATSMIFPIRILGPAQSMEFFKNAIAKNRIFDMIFQISKHNMKLWNWWKIQTKFDKFE